MEKQVYRRSIILRILVWFFNIFCTYFLFLSIIQNDFGFIPILIIGMIFLSVLTIRTFVKYIFIDDKIIFKYPFFKQRIYYIDDIIGLDFERNQAENWFIIYFENKKIKIENSGRKLRDKIKSFYDTNKNRIIEKNIEKINTTGFVVKISNNRLVFYNNRIEIAGKKNAVYYYDKDISSAHFFEIEGDTKTLSIKASDNYVMHISSHKCKGGLGLYDFLLDRIKIPNVA